MMASPIATPDQVAREQQVERMLIDEFGVEFAAQCPSLAQALTTALEARDAEIERLKSELAEARREILVYLETRIPAALEATAKDATDRGREQLAAELLGHLDRCTSTTAAFHLIKSLCQIEVGIEPNSLGAVVDEK